MAALHTNTVDYDAPPVVEVALSSEFVPPAALNEAHLGGFWSSQRAVFPKVFVRPPIGPSNEDFALDRAWIPPPVRFAISGQPRCRFQLASDDEQWMCQVQSDRFVMNWRKRRDEYPRYQRTLEQFRQVWRTFCEFVQVAIGETLTPTTWEVTYVNQVPQGELWKRVEDWPEVFPGLWPSRLAQAQAALELRGLQGQWVWEMPRDVAAARLYVEASLRRLAADPPLDALLLNLTARGPVRPESVEEPCAREASIVEGLNRGHDLVVQTFDALGSPRAKLHWRRHE